MIVSPIKLRTLPWGALIRRQYILPVLAGFGMACAGLLPWLNEPLGGAYSAWQLPVDIGWQFRIGIFNYGMLYLCCAGFSFALALARWQLFPAQPTIAHRTRLAGCLCLLPVGLFLLQYLCADLVGINQLAEHSKQWLFIQRHFDYATAKPLIRLNPFALDISTIQMRFQLLADRVSIGPLFALVSGCMLFAIPKQHFIASAATKKHNRLTRLAGWLLFMLAIVVVCGRAPASFICEQQARTLLAQGDYASALQWLDRAAILNPALDQVAYFHIERGEALYFLQPDQQSIESQFYLASAYLQQRSTVNAYRQLYPLWQAHRSVPWIANEMSDLLERLVENARPLSTIRVGGLNIKPLTPEREQANDEVALSWLAILSQVDPGNVFGQYLIGRIDYELHDYAACISHMVHISSLSSNPAIQSSAYTYMALSNAGQGNYIDERLLLLKAIALDPSYWNNTAREELSGLR